MPSPSPSTAAIPTAACDAAKVVVQIANTPLAQLSADLASARKLISRQDSAVIALPEFERALLRDISRVRDALDLIESGSNDAAAAYLSEARDDVEAHYQLTCNLPT
jgi:hypothetical protein